MRLAVLRFALFFAALAANMPARAEVAETELGSDDPDGWRPGERVTARLKGEPRFSDKLRSGDGVYGRFDGDLFLSLGAGIEWNHDVRPAVEGRALYYHSVGIVLRYADAFDRDAFVRRDGSIGLEVRPLFLPRWALDKEFQSAFFDLALDSLSIGVAGYLAAPRAGDEKLGVELFAGLGLPLLARASGPWLEARGFWRPGYEAASTGLLVTLSYYVPIVTPLVK